MYKWIFISTYKFYSKFKNEQPRFSAAAVVALSQFAILFLIVAILKRQMIWDATKYIPNKYVVLPFGLGWLAIIHNYYSQESITTLLSKFDAFPKWKRRFWAVMSLVFFILPMILFGFAASKP